MLALTKNAGSPVLRGVGVLFLITASLAPSHAAENLRERAIQEYYRGAITESARTLEAAIRSNPQDTAAYLDAAVVYRDLDNPKDSHRHFRVAAKLQPHDPHIHAAYAWSALRIGNIQEASSAFKKALSLSLDLPQATLGLAHLHLKANRPKAALSTAQRIVAVRPDITLGHVLEGRALHALGRKTKAAKAFTRAFKSDNTYSEIRLWLGPLYQKLHRYNDAWRQYAKVLYVSPRHANAQKQKKKLASHITRAPEKIIPPVRQENHVPIQLSPGDPKMPIMRVAVGTTVRGRPAAKKIIAFICDGPFEVIDPETGKRLLTGPAHTVWTARRIARGESYAYVLQDQAEKRRAGFRKVIAIRPQNPRRHSLIFQRLNIAAGTVWEFQGDRQLKGTVEIRALGGRGLYLINQVPLEDYVYGVINQEMPRRYPPEALKAQAVIARNHALQSKSYKLHKRYGYDLCDGQHCQVYSGILGEANVGRTAVDATRGLVLKYNGRLAHTPYSSNCGGHTQDSGEAKGWTHFPYLRGTRDDDDDRVDLKSPWELERWMKSLPDVYCNAPPYMHPSQFRWSRIISATELGNRLRRRSKTFGFLRGIRILKRSKSGNVNKIEFRGTLGRILIDREQKIRSVLGVGSARSTLFTLEIERDGHGIPTDIFMYGAGWGHSIGLCQIGAAGRGAAGQTYDRILSHYYTGTRIQSLGYGLKPD